MKTPSINAEPLIAEEHIGDAAALAAELIAEAQRCRIVCLSYADMAGQTPARINNLINTRYFFKP